MAAPRTRTSLDSVGILLVIATLAAFAEVRHREFVNYDDVLYVAESSGA